MTNPFEVMEKYSNIDLEEMNREELLVVQRSVMFPEEQEIFDRGGYIFLKPGDGRIDFLDYTDSLLNKQSRRGG